MQWYEALLFFYLLGINLVTLIAYGLDKLFAIRKRFRISEAFLLITALLGGAYGALLGMVLFHHKISKPKFRYTVPLIATVYLALLLAYLIQIAWGVII